MFNGIVFVVCFFYAVLCFLENLYGKSTPWLHNFVYVWSGSGNSLGKGLKENGFSQFGVKFWCDFLQYIKLHKNRSCQQLVV